MIRIAVNLLLVLAMMLQPLAVAGSAGRTFDCGGQTSGPAMCAVCGCCEFAGAEQRCCCGPAAAKTTVSADDCDDAALSRADSQTSLSLCLCGKRHQPLPNRSGETTKVNSSDSVIRAWESYCCSDDWDYLASTPSYLSIAARPRTTRSSISLSG